MSGILEHLFGTSSGYGLFLEALTQIGTFAGAISGVRMASAKRFDWFGAYVIGLVTALGGGTLRDMLLGVMPFWMESPRYLATTLLAVVAVALFGRRFISEQITWFVFDTISISVFMVIGMEKVWHVKVAQANAMGTSFGVNDAMGLWWLVIMMGVITAVFGGVIRDIFINEVPLIFRKEIYALACAAGGFAYLGLYRLGVEVHVCALICIATIFAIRAVAIKYHLGVPVLSGRRSRLIHPHRAVKTRLAQKETKAQ